MSYLWKSPPPVKYKGLYNQGATCYLNSVLQVLFMTDDFKEAVERYPGTDCIDVQLRGLFGELRNRTAYTFDITNKLDIRQVCEQKDAAEYFEKILNLTSKEASQIFHGELTHRTVCLGCDTHTDADGQFWNLPLTLVDSSSDSSSEYSVVKGIEEYFKVSTFSEGNQMYCEKCDEKHYATIQFVMKHHPEVLMLLLKRFELNYYTMTYIKINHKVLIPYTLQIPENQTYELYAVVDHFGDLRHGHYSACIKSQVEERWFQFNDSWVTQMDFQPFQSDNFESSDSAYLLFYRKKSGKKKSAADTQTPEDIREESVPGGCSPTISDVGKGMVNEGEEVKETETEIPVDNNDRVSANSEEEVKLPVPRCNVEDQESSYHPMQGNHEENNESNDSLLQHLHVREKDEVKTAPGYEEVSGRIVEVEEKGGVSVSDEIQDHDESEKQDRVKKKRQQGHISTSSNDLTSEQGDINTCVTPKYLQEVRVDNQISNDGNVMKEKREKDRDEKREMREKGQHEDNEGKHEVKQSTRVDPVEKQQDEKDPKSYREVKQGGETKLKEDSEAASKVNSGANKVESRSETPLTKIHGDVRVDKETRNMVKDDQVLNQGGSSWYESSEQNIQGSKKQNRGDEQSYQVIDERNSDDSSQKKAHPKDVNVSVVEKHAKRSHSERTQDRNRSPHGKTGALVRSRSLPEGQREDGKKDRQVKSDEGIIEEKQLSKKGNYQGGIQKGQELVEEEITLETPKSETRKGESNFDLSKLLCGLGFSSKKAKRKQKTETSEQAAAKRPKGWRLSCIGSSDKNHSSESD